MKSVTFLQLRRKERYSKFGVYKVIPIKKTFRQSNNLFWLILIFSLMLFFYIYKTNNSEESYKPAMGIVVYSIFIFGYFVKFSLSLFFPELILNGNGIKFIGKKSIDWKEIKKIKIAYNGVSKISVVIIKRNSKKITESLSLSNLTEIKFFIRSFNRRYGTRKIYL
ncbi:MULTISPECIES: hypothetical protein [Epilithonimonas]|nr:MULTISPECIES: hypothetical protein [Epilithonimonas]